MKIRKAFFAALCIAALGLVACFSSWNGETGEGTISINLGNNPALTQRSVTEVPDDFNAEYIITLTSAAEEVKRTIPLNDDSTITVTIAVSPGSWNVEVKALLDKEPFAEGTNRVTVRAGENSSVLIQMVLIGDNINYYTVTFNSNGGSHIDGQIVEAGGTARQPDDPTREGYIFDGWYSDEDEYDFYTPVTANITLYARWKEVPLGSFAVTFDSNGGSHIDGQIVESGSTAGQPDDPTREGYNFAGWYSGEELYDFDTPVTGSITLYAKWEEKIEGAITIGITFDDDIRKPVVELKNDDGTPIDEITISRFGSDGKPQTYKVTVVNTYGFTIIKWEVPGVGAGEPVEGDGNSFTLNAANLNYNAVGKHVLYLTFGWNGMPYLVEIPFEVED